MIKLIVWDWNGTLFDDAHAVLAASNQSEIPFFGLAPLTLEEMRDIYEIPLSRAYEKLGIAPEVFRTRSPEIAPLFHKIYEPLAAKGRTRIGARDMLQKLTSQNLRCIILSNHTMEGIYLQLARLKLAPYFTDLLANNDLNESHHTGKQHRLESFLEKNEYNRSEVAIVGDTPEEVRIGRNLGLHTISITGGMCSRERLAATSPDYLAGSINQVLNILKGMI